MHSPLHEQLMHEIYTIITLARPVVEAIERRDRDLGTQIRRALNSLALNTAEGLGCRAGHARNRFETAHGSVFEVSASLGRGNSSARTIALSCLSVCTFLVDDSMA